MSEAINPTTHSPMKTTLLTILATAFAAAAHAAPLPPAMSAAIGGGVSAAMQLRTAAPALAAPSLAIPAAPRFVPAAPAPARIFIAPAPARAR